MKKTNYVATLYYKSGGEIIETPPLSDAVAESIVAQANAGQTIHMFDGSIEYIIPWESVVEVQYRRITEDVEAPIDAICTEEEVKPQEGFVLVPCEGASIRLVSPNCTLLIQDSFDAIFCDLLLDGESILDNTDYAVDGFDVDGFELITEMGAWGKPVDCDSVGATYPVTFTVAIETPDGMENVTQTVTLPVESGGGGGGGNT